MITNLKTNILVLFFTIIILFLIYPKILYEYFVFQMPFSDQAPQSYFADWTVIISAIKCKLLGNDVFLNKYFYLLSFLTLILKNLGRYYFMFYLFLVQQRCLQWKDLITIY